MNITDMNVFPNPTNGEVNVSIPESVTVNVSIFDAQGKLVAEQMNVTNNGKLNISNVTPGVYMVRLTAENAVQTFRVVKN
jgi:PKD repeat protein